MKLCSISAIFPVNRFKCHCIMRKLSLAEKKEEKTIEGEKLYRYPHTTFSPFLSKKQAK